MREIRNIKMERDIYMYIRNRKIDGERERYIYVYKK